MGRTLKRSMQCSLGILLLTLVCDVNAAEASATYLRVKNVPQGNVVWIRSAPAYSSKRIGQLPYDARHVRSYGCQRLTIDRWCKVRYLGVRGWVSQRYLAVDRSKKV